LRFNGNITGGPLFYHPARIPIGPGIGVR
jgi:hypothetical protein